MALGTRNLNIRYVVDYADRGTRQALAQDRKLRASVKQTGASMSASASKAAAAQQRAARAAGRHAGAQSQVAASGRRATAAVASQGRAATAASASNARGAVSAQRTARSYDQVARAANRAASAQARQTAAARRRVRGAAGRGAGLLGFAGAFGAAGAIRQTVEFDKALRNVNSIAQLSETRLQAVGKRVRELGGRTAQQPATLAKGMYDLVSSGFDVKQSMTILGKSARAATAGLTTTEVSTKAVAAVLNAYKLPASEAGVVSDQLFRTVDRGVISFEELASNVGDVLPFASSLGVGLDQVGASISTMTKAGIPASETMTRIKAVMTTLLKPGGDLKDALKGLGFESGEALIKQEGFQGALEKLAKTTGGSKEELAALFPNVRALGGALALTGKNAGGARKDLDGLGKSSGATNKALKEQAKSTALQWEKLKANASAVAITVGNKVLPVLNAGMKGVLDFGRAHPTVAKLAGAVVGVGVAFKALKFASALTGVTSLGRGLRRLARSRAGQAIAESVISKVSAIPGKTKAALGGMKSLLGRLFGRAGTAGGSSMATSVADTAAGSVGPRLSRKRARFASAGRGVGTSLGRAGGASAATTMSTVAGDGVVASAAPAGRLGSRFSRAGRIVGKGFGLAAGVAVAFELGKAIDKKLGATDKTFGTRGGGPYALDPIGGLVDIFKQLGRRRTGGTVQRYAAGGTVPVMLSSGEMGVEPSGRTFTVGGPRVAADNVLAHVQPGTDIVTGHGQQLLAGGASLSEAMGAQLPHFASGGRVARAAYRAGFRGAPLTTGVAVAGAESGWNPRAQNRNTNGSIDRGWWQINSIHGALSTFNERRNAEAAFRISGGGKDWSPWVAYNAGAHKGWLGRASRAVRSMGSVPRSALTGRGREKKVALPPKLTFGGGLPSPAGAFSSGFSAGLEGTPLRDTDVLPDISAASRAKLTRRTATIPAGRRGSAGGSPPTGRGGNARVSSLIAEMHRIDRKKIPYVYGGGHTNPAPANGPFDCSSALARVMQAAGFNFPTGVSGGYMRYGRPGRGKFVSIMSNPGHTYMAVRRKPSGGWSAWGTSASNPAGSPGWVSGQGYPFRGGFTTVHPKGYRRGGRVGRALTGLAGLPAGAPRKSTGALRDFAGLIDTVDQVGARIIRAQLRAVRARLRRVARGGITRAERPRARDLRGEIRGLRQDLSGGPSYRRLERIERNIGRRVRRMGRGGITRTERVGIRRLESAQRLVQVEMGRRVGLIARTVERQAESIERGRSRLSRSLRTRGIDEASSAGIAALRAYTTAIHERLLNSQRRLRVALRRATRRGDRGAVTDLADRLRGVREELAEAMASWVEQGRAQIVAAAQERADAAASVSSISSLRLERVELEQRLAGTFDTGGQARADAIRRTILPALQGELVALQGQLLAARQVGDAALARQIAEALEGKLNEQLQAQLDIKDATESTAENTAELSGSLGFEFRGQKFSDLVNIGTGA